MKSPADRPGEPLRVLITDGHLKTSLAAVRSLGRRGMEVHTLQQRQGSTVCSASRFHEASHLMPAYADAERFDAAFLDLLRCTRFDHVLITSEGALRRIAANRGAVASLTRVDLPPPKAIEIVLSKEALLGFAVGLGIRLPKTIVHHDGDRLDATLAGLSFPVVAKTGEGGAYERVRYLNDARELERHLAGRRGGGAVILQEYVEGDGYGFFALFRDGDPVVSQMHRRIWEYPPTGGPSALAETVEEPELEGLGLRLLEALEWNGLAMVEFKRARSDDAFVLMEINPRLWGSLDLCIASGVDFPCRAVLGDRLDTAPVEKRKTTYMFVVPDAALFLAARPTRVLEFARRLLSPEVRTNVVRDDLRPLWHQFREFLYWMKTLLPRAALRYPHGRPRRRGLFEFDLHVHTSHSYDSWSGVRRLLRRARKAGLSAVAITDHETIEGAKHAAALNTDPGLTVIVGEEIRTDAGDIVGLFLEREIRSRAAMEVVKEIKDQGGLVMLPHPFSYGVSSYDARLLDQVDLIEIRNARTRKESVEAVLTLAKTHNLVLVGNSDSHFSADVGRTRNCAATGAVAPGQLKELLRSGGFVVVNRKVAYHRVPLSQMIKSVKKRNPRRAVFHAWWCAKSLLKDLLVSMFGEPPPWRAPE